MNIKVNGETRQFEEALSIAALAQKLNLKPTQVAIERNLEIVPRSRYGETMLTEGDEIEIVQFIGGG